MATRSCPDCGAQYVASVRRCIDCDVALVDDVQPAASGTAAPVRRAESGEGEVGYVLEGWGNQLKVTLEGMLDKAGIRRVWEAGALVVSAEDEATVDALIATVEGAEDDAAGHLDDETPRVAFDIEDLDADLGADLEARLRAEGIPHAWDDEGALIVAEADEERVTGLVEEVLDEQDEDDGGDGMASLQALSELYVAVDRLQKNPHDRKLVNPFLRNVVAVRDLPVPYGFSAGEWSDLIGRSDALAARLAERADRDAREAWVASGEGDETVDADAVPEGVAGADLGTDTGTDTDADTDTDATERDDAAERDDATERDDAADGEDVADGEDETAEDVDRRLAQELRGLLQDYV